MSKAIGKRKLLIWCRTYVSLSCLLKSSRRWERLKWWLRMKVVWNCWTKHELIRRIKANSHNSSRYGHRLVLVSFTWSSRDLHVITWSRDLHVITWFFSLGQQDTLHWHNNWRGQDRFFRSGVQWIPNICEPNVCRWQFLLYIRCWVGSRIFLSLSSSIEEMVYNTIQYNCLFRAPIAKNKSYSKALYIVQCTVTTTLLSVIYLKKMSFEFSFEWSDRWRVTEGDR